MDDPNAKDTNPDGLVASQLDKMWERPTSINQTEKDNTMTTPIETTPTKKWYKKWWGITLIVFGSLTLIGAISGGGDKTETADSSPVTTVPAASNPPVVTNSPVVTTTAPAALQQAIEVDVFGDETYIGDYSESKRSCGFVEGDGPCWLITLTLKTDCSDGVSLEMPGLKADGAPTEKISDMVFDGGYKGQTIKFKVSASKDGTVSYGPIQWSCLSF